MPWFEKLNKVYQLLFVVAGLLGIVGSAMGVAGAISVRIIDARIRYQVEPVQDMSEFALRASGQWDNFIEFQQKKKRDREAIESRRASRAQLDPSERNN